MAENDHAFLDLNGQQVHAFASQMANLGYAQLTDLLIAMFKSGAWHTFRDGLGQYKFLPGEFDYFLSQQGVKREDIMAGVKDIETKAQLEAAMDERRTGEPGYRRRILEAREANPQRPGRPIEPYGLTRAEAKALVNSSEDAVLTKPATRQPLGRAVRRWIATGGETTKRPNEQVAPVERLRRSAIRLADEDLDDLIESLKQERRRRRRDT